MNSKVIRILVNTLLAALVVAGGVMVARNFMENKVETPEKERSETGTLVEVIPVARSTQSVRVKARGTVVAAREVNIKTQVSGRVKFVNPNLVRGGVVTEGEVLFEVEQSDYNIGVQNARNAIKSAQAQLTLEKGRGKVAERELKLFAESKLESVDPISEKDMGLARREPQVASAVSQVEIAKAQLRKARLDLSRTTVKAPFNARILNETIEIGDVVGPGAPVATLVGSDELWIEVSIPTEETKHIAFPDAEGKGGSAAWVNKSEDHPGLEGRVVRLLPDLDMVGRMARVVVSIPDPYAQAHPLFVREYVDIEIEGNRQIEGIEIPRSTVRNGNEVWVAAKDDTLEIRTIETGWRFENTVVVTKGLAAGDRVIRSRLGTPVKGMKLRIAEKPLAADDDESESAMRTGAGQ